MAGIKIVNPFAGSAVTWTWDQHKAAGYSGGTDYGYGKDKPVTSPADGRVTVMNDGLNGLRVTLADSRSIVIRENKSFTGTIPRDVRLGEQIAVSCRVNGSTRMYEHIEGWVNGVRVPFEPMIYTPPVVVVNPNQRQVKSSAGVKRRALPNTNDSTNPGINPPIAASTVTTPAGWVTGQAVSGSTVWFENADGTYSHSSGFTDGGTHDLTNLNTVKVTFDALGGEPDPVDQTITINTRAVEPEEPVKEGYTFGGWVTIAGDFWDFDTLVAGSMDLFADWTLVPDTGCDCPSLEDIQALLATALQPIEEKLDILIARKPPKYVPEEVAEL